jgi:hypothetical protein
MKKYINIKTATALAVASIGLLCVIVSYQPVKPGQVWIFEVDKGNPFHSFTETNTVIAVSNGYVQYTQPCPAWIGGGWITNTLSDSVSWFKAGSTLLK